MRCLVSPGNLLPLSLLQFITSLGSQCCLVFRSLVGSPTTLSGLAIRVCVCVCVCVCVGGRGWGCLTEKRVTSVEELIYPPKAKSSITDCFPVSQSCTLRRLMAMQARRGLRRMRVTAQLHVESGQEGSDVHSPNTACPKQRHRLRKPSFPLRNRSCPGYRVHACQSWL